VNVEAPATVSGFTDDVTSEESLSRKAMFPAPISIGAVPNALLRTIRTRLPPTLVRTICRSV
jgi:hypothetical protein